jgi:hypothetical protein
MMRDTEEIRFPSDLNTIASFVAALGSVTLALAVLYEVSYFYILGLPFFGIQTTSDLFRSSIRWLPFSFVVFVALPVIASRSRIFKPKIINTWQELARKHDRDRFKWTYGDSAILGLILSSMGTYVSDPEQPIALGGSLVLAYNNIIFRMIYYGYDFLRATTPYKNLLYYIVPSFLTFVPFWGAQSAYDDIKKVSPAFLVRSSQFPSMISVVLRAGEKGVLLREPNKAIHFIPWDNVKSLTMLRPPTTPRSLWSRFSQFWWPQKPIEP